MPAVPEVAVLASRPDLRIDPAAPPSVAGALDRAASRLAAAVRSLDADARGVAPWLGDPVSAEAAARYGAHATGGPGAAIDRLRALHVELARARDAVAAAGRGYTATDDALARAWGAR